MELSKFKKLALVAVAAGLSTQPVIAAGNETVAEATYYTASCGGSQCGNKYPKPYTQTNPAPIAMDEDTSGGKTQMVPPQKNGTQPPAMQGQKPNGSTQASRYYQKRDREVADNAPNFSPSNGLLPNQQKSGTTTTPKTGSGSTSTSPSSTSGSSMNNNSMNNNSMNNSMNSSSGKY